MTKTQTQKPEGEWLWSRHLQKRVWVPGEPAPEVSPLDTPPPDDGTKLVICPGCGGDGMEEATDERGDCPLCGGDGLLKR